MEKQQCFEVKIGSTSLAVFEDIDQISSLLYLLKRSYKLVYNENRPEGDYSKHLEPFSGVISVEFTTCTEEDSNEKAK